MSMGAAALGRQGGQADGDAELEDPDPPVSGGFEGQATDIEIHAREIIDVRQRLDKIIAKHTNQSLEKVSKDTERDYFMLPKRPSSTTSSAGVIDNRCPPDDEFDLFRLTDGQSQTRDGALATFFVFATSASGARRGARSS